MIKGWRTLIRKIPTFLALPATALVVVVIRLLSPLVLIRFGAIESRRLGHFAANTELYLCERDVGRHPRRAVDIFFHLSPVCNRQLKKMWDRTLHVSRFAKWPCGLISRLPGFGSHLIPMPVHRDIHGILARTPAHLSFTPEEECLGRAALVDLGVPEGVPFVCFFARDSAYLDSELAHANPTGSWRYHDYRDSCIQNQVVAVEKLTRQGYFAIRMGAVVKSAMDTANPMIIDYAVKSRTDFLDIYLGANCLFFLGDFSGVTAIPMVFRRPSVCVNLIPLTQFPNWGPDDLFIPKKLWLREERRFLTFREILDSDVGWFLDSGDYDQRDIEAIENTPEEITAVAEEMDQRLKSEWQTTKEDEELQRRFWAFFKSSDLHGVFLSRIGAEFLHENLELLN